MLFRSLLFLLLLLEASDEHLEGTGTAIVTESLRTDDASGIFIFREVDIAGERVHEIQHIYTGITGDHGLDVRAEDSLDGVLVLGALDHARLGVQRLSDGLQRDSDLFALVLRGVVDAGIVCAGGDAACDAGGCRGREDTGDESLSDDADATVVHDDGRDVVDVIEVELGEGLHHHEIVLGVLVAGAIATVLLVGVADVAGDGEEDEGGEGV